MTECPECAQAKARRWHGIYMANCTGCSARAAARSLAAFNALDPRGNGDKEPLRELVLRVLPKLGMKQAREAVWTWWQIDHAKDEEKSPGLL